MKRRRHEIADRAVRPHGVEVEPPGGERRTRVAEITYIADRGRLRVLGGDLGRPVTPRGRLCDHPLNRRARLALAALKAAIRIRWPPKGCVHHSDRGAQYAAARKLLPSMGWSDRMGRRGNPHANANAESFARRLLRARIPELITV